MRRVRRVGAARAGADAARCGCFATAAFRAASLVALAYGVGLFGSTYLLPVFVQEIAHYNAASAGSLMFLPGLALAVSIAIGGRLTDRFEPRFVMIAGLRAVRDQQRAVRVDRRRHVVLGASSRGSSSAASASAC